MSESGCPQRDWQNVADGLGSLFCLLPIDLKRHFPGIWLSQRLRTATLFQAVKKQIPINYDQRDGRTQR